MLRFRSGIGYGAASACCCYYGVQGGYGDYLIEDRIKVIYLFLFGEVLFVQRVECDQTLNADFNAIVACLVT